VAAKAVHTETTLGPALALSSRRTSQAVVFFSQGGATAEPASPVRKKAQ
jgi:hypothetical protein